RDLDRVGQIRDRILVRFPHVHEDEAFATVTALLELLDADLRHASEHRRRRYQRRFAAEGLVVDEPGDGRPGTTHRALRVLANAELPEAHRERVDQDETSDERLADAEENLQRLDGLHRPEKARQNTENAALGAARHEARRRGLREEAAIARSLRRPEDG